MLPKWQKRLLSTRCVHCGLCAVFVSWCELEGSQSIKNHAAPVHCVTRASLKELLSQHWVTSNCFLHKLSVKEYGNANMHACFMQN